MRKMIYNCDKCKKKVEAEGNLLTVSIELKPYMYGKNFGSISLDLCLQCREKAGFSKRVITEEKVIEEPATTKDKLYDVVCALIQETGIRVEY